MWVHRGGQPRISISYLPLVSASCAHDTHSCAAAGEYSLSVQVHHPTSCGESPHKGQAHTRRSLAPPVQTATSRPNIARTTAAKNKTDKSDKSMWRNMWRLIKTCGDLLSFHGRLPLQRQFDRKVMPPLGCEHHLLWNTVPGLFIQLLLIIGVSTRSVHHSNGGYNNSAHNK